MTKPLLALSDVGIHLSGLAGRSCSLGSLALYVLWLLGPRIHLGLPGSLGSSGLSCALLGSPGLLFFYTLLGFGFVGSLALPRLIGLAGLSWPIFSKAFLCSPGSPGLSWASQAPWAMRGPPEFWLTKECICIVDASVHMF